MNPNYFLVVAIAIVMGWFAFGVLYNLQKGNALLRWLQVGLPRIGERTTLRWLGTSVVELVIAQAHKPFRRLETLVVLAPRDIPWLWLMAISQGRRDTLIFRANLSSPPHIDLELADPTSWTGRMAISQAMQQGWESQPFQNLQLMAVPGLLTRASQTLTDLAIPMQRLEHHYFRLHLSRSAPHLEVHIPFPDRRSNADSFIAALQELAQAVSERP